MRIIARIVIVINEKISDMGVLGDMIRLVRDTTKESLEECGIDDLKSEIKDVIKALKGK